MRDKNPISAEYLGDGVTASYDGYQVWLDLSAQGSSCAIALDPSVFNRLVEFRSMAVRAARISAEREWDEMDEDE